MFAKLFDTELGQILVKIDANDNDDPEVRVYFEPDGLGVCGIAMSWTDDTDDVKWEKSEEAFNKMNEKDAIAMVNSVIDNM